MIESGAFTEDDRIELLDGWVVDKMPKKPTHSIVTGNLQDLLAPQLPAGWHIRNQEPLTLSLSEPEPDLAIVAGTRNDYAHAWRVCSERDGVTWAQNGGERVQNNQPSAAQGHPMPADTAVVIEIAETTLADDRWKQHVYAADGLPTYCLLNLPDNVVELHAAPRPTDSEYADRQVIAAADPYRLTVGTTAFEFRLSDVMPS